jgi:hypothetical protein
MLEARWRFIFFGSTVLIHPGFCAFLLNGHDKAQTPAGTSDSPAGFAIKV